MENYYKSDVLFISFATLYDMQRQIIELLYKWWIRNKSPKKSIVSYFQLLYQIFAWR
jgi:hypothetical protein